MVLFPFVHKLVQEASGLPFSLRNCYAKLVKLPESSAGPAPNDRWSRPSRISWVSPALRASIALCPFGRPPPHSKQRHHRGDPLLVKIQPLRPIGHPRQHHTLEHPPRQITGRIAGNGARPSGGH